MKVQQAATRKWLAFASIAMGTFMAYVDMNIVNIALPVIARDYGVGLSDVKWVVTAYLLMVTALVVIFGRIADLYGRKRLYVFGFSVFTIGAALCSIAPTLWMLIACRAIEGIGGAALMANGSAILTESFPPEERGKALGSLGSVIALAALAGPLLGGIVSENFGWRTIFLLVVPVGVIGSVLALRALPSGGAGRQGERFDFGGAVTLVAGLTCFLFLTSSMSSTDGGQSTGAMLLIGMTVLMAGFLLIESRVAHPLLDLSLFRNRAFSAAIVASFLSFWAMSVLSFLLPFYLDRVKGMSPTQIGVLFIPVPLILFIVAPLAGRLSDRFGARLICTSGAVVNFLALLGMSTLSTETSTLGVILRMLPFGVGSGLFTPPNNSAIMGAVPKSRLGIASGMISAIKSLGSMSGVAVTSFLFVILQQYFRRQAIGPGAATADLERETFASAVAALFLISAAIVVVVIFTSLVRGKETEER
ncbi:MAG: MFS transporter [Acidobacteria bacterium]|nr:MFS transporter [Acidobacteriota bacterium]